MKSFRGYFMFLPIVHRFQFQLDHRLESINIEKYRLYNIK
jgi:hypothetical protein